MSLLHVATYMLYTSGSVIGPEMSKSRSPGDLDHLDSSPRTG